ncbi:MAG: hypothetical protein ABIR80_02735, partial [Opitutaceae bacterium]
LEDGKTFVEVENRDIDTGNNAWAMIALLALYERTGKTDYLETARRIGAFIQAFRDTSGTYQGFRGGIRDAETTLATPRAYTSTEHNLDIVAAFTKMFRITGESKWSDDAEHARTLVEAMWDPTKGGYRTGTNEASPETRNEAQGQFPLDVQTWNVLARTESLTLHPQLLNTIEQNHRTTRGGLIGYDFNDDRDGLWFEGSGHAALAYRVAQQTAKSEEILSSLRSAQQIPNPAGDGMGIVAASHDGVSSGFNFKWFRRLHVGATAWNIAAQLGFNPYYPSAVGVPVIVSPPQHLALAPNSSATFSVVATGTAPFSYQWRKDGVLISGATLASYTVPNVQSASTGLYTITVSGVGTLAVSDPAILGLLIGTKVIGTATEVGANIAHPNGNTFDQVLLEGAAASITADSALNQITRLSYLDLNDDIVQIEFAGAGTLSIVLDNPSGPAAPLKYNQSVTYMKGHAGIVVTGANETTNLSVFSVGRANAVNQALFRDDITYDGFADLAFIAILSANGKFGGLRTANASYFTTRGYTGIFAPNVEFTGPVFVSDINASDAATPVLVLGSASDVRITGGDMQQSNNRPVQVSGIAQLKFAAGVTSHGGALPAQTNKARFEQNGSDVTEQIVVNPTP